MKNRTVLLAAAVVLGSLVLLTALGVRATQPRRMTFEACEEAGGEAWLVDLYHPDICPSCAAYQACAGEVNDYTDVCPECYGPCQACQEKYSVYQSCPECYGPCQECQNEYLSDFASEEERYRLCPTCMACDECREEINENRANCPPCVSCRACKEENKRYTDIADVCPQVVPCSECASENFPYANTCPGGKEKIGEISDAAIWFQCCR